MEEAQRLADRVGLLADGTLIALDSPDQLVAEHGGDSQLIVDGSFDEAAVSAIDYPAETALRNGRLVVYGIRPESIGNITEQLEQAGIEYDSLTGNSRTWRMCTSNSPGRLSASAVNHNRRSRSRVVHSEFARPLPRSHRGVVALSSVAGRRCSSRSSSRSSSSSSSGR